MLSILQWSDEPGLDPFCASTVMILKCHLNPFQGLAQSTSVVQYPLIITGIEPSIVKANVPTELKISGHGFSSTLTNTLTIKSVECTILNVTSSKELFCMYSAPATTSRRAIEDAASATKTASSSEDQTATDSSAAADETRTSSASLRNRRVACSFSIDSSSHTPTCSLTITQVNVPDIVSVKPSSGSAAGGYTVTVTGTNFAADATVTFSGAKCGFQSFKDNGGGSFDIVCTAPAAPIGQGYVVVTVDGQASAPDEESKYEHIFYVNSVSPTLMGLGGGTTVSVTGSGFAWPDQEPAEVCSEIYTCQSVHAREHSAVKLAVSVA